MFPIISLSHPISDSKSQILKAHSLDQIKQTKLFIRFLFLIEKYKLFQLLPH